MRQENVQFFTDKEEEFAHLLINLGMKKNVATILVFFTSNPEATSWEIEHATDLRQPEVSIAMKYLIDQGWVKSHESHSEHKGRPMKVFGLAKPISRIMDSIETEKKNETKNQLALIGKLRDFLS